MTTEVSCNMYCHKLNFLIGEQIACFSFLYNYNTVRTFVELPEDRGQLISKHNTAEPLIMTPWNKCDLPFPQRTSCSGLKAN